MKYKYSFETSKSIDDVKRIIAENIETDFTKFLFNKSDKKFRGQLYNDTFKMWLNTHIQDSTNPVYYGKIERTEYGTRIYVTKSAAEEVKYFLKFIFVILCIGFIYSLYSCIFNGTSIVPAMLTGIFVSFSIMISIVMKKTPVSRTEYTLIERLIDESR